MKSASLKKAIEKLGGTAVINLYEIYNGGETWVRMELRGELNGYTIEADGNDFGAYSVQRTDSDNYVFYRQIKWLDSLVPTMHQSWKALVA